MSPLLGPGRAAAARTPRRRAEAAAAPARRAAAAAAAADSRGGGAQAPTRRPAPGAPPAEPRTAKPRASEAMQFFHGVVLLCPVRFRARPCRFRRCGCAPPAPGRDEDLAVADLAGAGRAFDGLDHAVDDRVVDRGFDLHLGQEVDHVLGAAVQLGVALLAAEALDLGHRDALHADGAQGFAHFVELERLDDGGHHLHGLFSSTIDQRVLDERAHDASCRDACRCRRAGARRCLSRRCRRWRSRARSR